MINIFLDFTSCKAHHLAWLRECLVVSFAEPVAEYFTYTCTQSSKYFIHPWSFTSSTEWWKIPAIKHCVNNVINVCPNMGWCITQDLCCHSREDKVICAEAGKTSLNRRWDLQHHLAWLPWGTGQTTDLTHTQFTVIPLYSLFTIQLIRNVFMTEY